MTRAVALRQLGDAAEDAWLAPEIVLAEFEDMAQVTRGCVAAWAGPAPTAPALALSLDFSSPNARHPDSSAGTDGLSCSYSRNPRR